MTQKILVATHNENKIEELTTLLDELEIRWLTLNDLGVTCDVDETGTTYRENALLKADETPRLPDAVPQAAVISLGRFDREAIQELSRSMLGQEQAAREEVTALLAQETEGGDDGQ